MQRAVMAAGGDTVSPGFGGALRPVWVCGCSRKTTFSCILDQHWMFRPYSVLCADLDSESESSVFDRRRHHQRN